MNAIHDHLVKWSFERHICDLPFIEMQSAATWCLRWRSTSENGGQRWSVVVVKCFRFVWRMIFRNMLARIDSITECSPRHMSMIFWDALRHTCSREMRRCSQQTDDRRVPVMQLGHSVE